jgi:hypothetical protein
MHRIQVKSSQIKSIGWEPNFPDSETDNGVLQVEFTSLAVYEYKNVPYTIYRQFLAAESKGSYLANHIKGAFEYARLHVQGCDPQALPMACDASQCPCWCHKIRKDVTNGAVPNPNLEKELKKSIKAAKAKKSA